jgi:hypothetical protein
MGKLGLATKGYGTVNLPLLLVGLLWSIGACFVAATTYGIDLKRKQLVYLFLGNLALVAVTAVLGVLFDYWFSTSLFLALGVEISEPNPGGVRWMDCSVQTLEAKWIVWPDRKRIVWSTRVDICHFTRFVNLPAGLITLLK